MQAIFETLFDIVYLVTVVILGIRMIRGSRGRKQYLLFGIMAVVLGCGDAFHLVPRAIALCTTGLENYTTALGVGKLITSVTMTLFYVLLYYVWRCRYQISGQQGITAAVWVLAIVRVLLCFMPQNEWTSAAEKQDRVFRFLWIAVVVSFACYIPVVLFAETVPAAGMLMIPKTCAYVWVVLIGYRAMKEEKGK
ncbi:MAG: hypothetical protein MRZ69_03385 [Lachnospiraceae bacterium]|nr:hypothetical protein [Lachnospiraceae bacterium]